MARSTENTGPRRKRSIAANTAMNGVAQFASILSTLVFFPLLVRAFSVEGYGVYVIAISVTSVALMFDLGIGAATVRMVAARLSLDDTEGFWRVASTAAALLAGVGVLVGAVVAAVGLVADDIFNVTDAQAGLLRTLLLIGGALQLWYWPTSVASHVLGGLERYDLVARTSLVSTLANVGMIGIVLLTDGGPVLLMVLGAFVTIGASLINLTMLARVGPGRRLVSLPSRPIATEIISVGMPVFVAGMAQFFNREQADRLVVGVMIGPAAVAVYEVAAKLSMLIAQGTGLTTSAVLPVASGMAARGDETGLRELFVSGGRYVSLIIVPLVAALLVLADPFIGAWFGADFVESVPLAYVLVAAQVFVPLYQTGDAILIGRGRFGRWVPRGLALALANLVLSVFLVSRVGLIGVAIGTLVTTLAELPLYAQVILPETRAGVREWLGAAVGAYALVPVVALASWLLGRLLVPHGLIAIAAAGAAAVALYWACAYALVLRPSERERVGMWVRHALGRTGGAA